jgi:hypothetical protein
VLKDVLPTAAFDAPDVSVYMSYCAAPRRVCLHELLCCTWTCLFTRTCAAPVQVSLQELLCCTWISYRDDKISFPDGWCKKSHAWAHLIRLAVKYAMEQTVEEKWWRLNPLYPPPPQLLTLLPSCFLCKYVNRRL